MLKRLVLFVVPVMLLSLIMVFDAPPAQSIHIIKNPSRDLIAKHGVHQWQTWEKEPSTFVWQFAETEKAYILEGIVHIRAEGSNQIHVLEKGDFVTFAPGLRCHWDVKEPFKKHVTHEKDFFGNIYWKLAFKAQALPRLIKETSNNFNLIAS